MRGRTGGLFSIIPKLIYAYLVFYIHIFWRPDWWVRLVVKIGFLFLFFLKSREGKKENLNPTLPKPSFLEAGLVGKLCFLLLLFLKSREAKKENLNPT